MEMSLETQLSGIRPRLGSRAETERIQRDGEGQRNRGDRGPKGKLCLFLHAAWGPTAASQWAPSLPSPTRPRPGSPYWGPPDNAVTALEQRQGWEWWGLPRTHRAASGNPGFWGRWEKDVDESSSAPFPCSSQLHQGCNWSTVGQSVSKSPKSLTGWLIPIRQHWTLWVPVSKFLAFSLIFHLPFVLILILPSLLSIEESSVSRWFLWNNYMILVMLPAHVTNLDMACLEAKLPFVFFVT